MEYRQETNGTEMNAVIESLERIRRFDGTPADFWSAFLEESARLTQAEIGMMLVREREQGEWLILAAWSVEKLDAAQVPALKPRIDEIAQASVRDGFAWEDAEDLPHPEDHGSAIGARLRLEEERVSAAVFFLGHEAGLAVQEAAFRLALLADSPAVYQLGRVANQAKSDVVRFAEALDLMVLLNAEKRYIAAAMTFCNELASRYRCDRVSLGWLHGAYVRVQAISHMERFEKKMEVVQILEAAMEEAFDQDEEILWPPPEESRSVARSHAAFAKEQGAAHIVSLPLRLDDQPVAVATCERSADPFSEEEVRGLRVLCDQSARRLGDLKHHDRWFGARMATWTRESLTGLLGVEHTFAKLMGLIIALLLAILLFGKLPYRVEASFILKTDDLAYLSAPFDGYIHEVHVKVGDQVGATAPLLSLDIRELLLEESTAIANKNRYSREADKARAQNALADMKVAMALEAQAKARLKLVRYHIAHARLKAPFAGIVVAGDLEELLGAPVRKGDVLFKVARIEKMYAELKVDERDIHELTKDATGEIAFVSRPDLKFPIRIERIDPVAVPEELENVFIVRALFPEAVSPWWRPGMSGVAKVDVGKRNILWIFTHRTIDFLRIFFWW